MPKYDMKVLQSCRKPYCELCGSPAQGWPHHIRTRGAGGKEIKNNLIQLCGQCHRKVHDGKIKRRELIEIVAKREALSVEEVYQSLGWAVEHKTPDEVKITSVLAGRTLEDLIELYIHCLEAGEGSMWDRAAIVTAINETGLKPAQIASMLGCSTSQVRKLTRTFNAFPTPESRINILSFRHHLLAAQTDDPAKWVNEAADNLWSTRQMQEQIMQQNGTLDPYEKAEKVLLKVEEILREKNEISAWLEEELKKLITPASLGYTGVYTEQMFDTGGNIHAD